MGFMQGKSLSRAGSGDWQRGNAPAMNIAEGMR
jgi:hypothetical protein